MKRILLLCMVLYFWTGSPVLAEDPKEPPGILGIGYEYNRTDAEAPGFQVVALLPGGPAETAGLQRGDFISKVNGQTYDNPTFDRQRDNPFAWVRPGDTVTLDVVRQGTIVELEVVAASRENFPTPRRRISSATGSSVQVSALERRMAEAGETLEFHRSTLGFRLEAKSLSDREKQAMADWLLAKPTITQGLLGGMEVGDTWQIQFQLDAKGAVAWKVLAADEEASTKD